MNQGRAPLILIFKNILQLYESISNSLREYFENFFASFTWSRMMKAYFFQS